MPIVIESPNEHYSVKTYHNTKLFLAGGISNCPDWQKELIDNLEDIEDLTIYNPRRKDFPMDDPNAANEQITWEYDKLKNSDIILFWFSRGSLNPIVLYELGKWGNSTDKNIIIGLDSKYERSQDVSIQTLLARPEVPFVTSLDAIHKLIEDNLKSRNEKNQKIKY